MRPEEKKKEKKKQRVRATVTDTKPPSARFARFVEKPITLQDGTKLPAGVIVEAAHLPITRDPNLYPDPEVWTFFLLQIPILIGSTNGCRC